MKYEHHIIKIDALYKGDDYVLWCIVVYCGVLWCIVVYCGVLWCIVVYCGVLWCIVDITFHNIYTCQLIYILSNSMDRN